MNKLGRVLVTVVCALSIIVTVCAFGTGGPGNINDPLPLGMVVMSSAAEVQAIINSGLDVVAVRSTTDGYELDIVLWPQDRKFLDHQKIDYDITDPDMKTCVEIASSYRSLNDYNVEMQAIADQYPNLARLHQIGTSMEGRPIYALEITAPMTAEDGRPESAFFGLHHAREWPSGEYTIMLAWDLVQKYGSDTAITNILDSTKVWLAPVINPDGFLYSQTVNSLWRKNRRYINRRTYGVDLNRNYSYWWGGSGSSGTASSSTYRGPSPFSESEAIAVRDLFLSRHIITMLSSHTYSELVLWPWGHTSANPPDATDLQAIGQQMATYNGYSPMQASSLYVASGITDDWTYGTTANYGFTFEDNTEFQPNYSLIQTTYNANYPAYVYLMQQALQQASTISGTVTDAVTGNPVTATMTLSRTYLTPRANGSTVTEYFASELNVSGNYSWAVTPSKMPMEATDPGYTLTVSAPGYHTYVSNVTITRRQTVTLNIQLQPL